MDPKRYSQEKTSWCWVAGTQIVIDYLKDEYHTQCTYYKWGKNKSSCSGNEGGDFYKDVANAFIGAKVQRGVVVSSGASLLTIREEIDKKRPLLARIGWKSKGKLNGAGHAIVIRGYNTDGDQAHYLWIKDGDNDTDYTSEYATKSISWLKNNNQFSWTHTRLQMG
ncbi:hypothetical protein A374_03984 [Fictibacillus macauensis ZFHKF-1]|uniref:Peptidase C39-like domain-containing protein n=1 Tax=Fictibacillus macauensis ZFHKF-1 TaxID=1196324 RepID=I8J4J8_9BACL|nr:C39 family peptidase [Fictibacillus macauensis]EIT86701.1 hypothetical protein A374_03984 [Fictibacillus macauensis ZFHKF-1]